MTSITCYTLSMIHEQIKASMVDAMRAKDTVKLGVIRGLLAMFQSEQIAKGNPEPFLSDADAMALIKRSVKQRKDSIEQFTNGGRNDLAETEKAELAILETYLPQMMSADDIRKIAESKKAELGVTDKAKIGMLMGAVMKATAGQADGGEVKKVVESLFT
jgi:uncharacterized protein